MQIHEHNSVDAQAVAAEELGSLEFVIDDVMQPEVHRTMTYAEARENSGGYNPRTELGISGRSLALGKRIIALKARYAAEHGDPIVS